MKKLIILLFLFGSFNLLAQQNDSGSTGGGDQWYTGGGLQVGFSSNSTVIGLNPILGYNITEDLSAGVGANVTYFKSGSLSTTVLGGNLFGRYLITPSIYAQSEFHMTSVDTSVIGPQPENGSSSEREWIPAFFVGGGYRQNIGARTAFNVTVLWDIIEDENSPYINPWITGGVTVGF